jgi:hypothetical protein
MKVDRKAIFNMYDGRCTYCGRPLGKTWHVDHIEPVLREKGKMELACRHAAENLTPACPPCNRSKSRMSLEHWRDWLAGHVTGLQRLSTYRLCIAYGLVVETEMPVKFYFETVREREALV